VQEGQHNCWSLDTRKQQQSTQALQQRDAASVHVCSWFLQPVVEGEIDLQLTFISNEAWFHFQGYISTKNNRYWISQNPHLTHGVLLHPVRVCVWCAVSARSVAVPVFFKRKICTGHLGHFFPELTEEERLYGWFKQDSATAHAARMSMQALFDDLGDRIISSGIWPERSPDLNPSNFFSRNCLRDKVYRSNPRTEELKENIRREIANIPAEQLQRVNQNLFRRCEECLRVEGQHFQNFLSSVNCNYFIRNVIGQEAY
jgi:hypothetical protein